MIEKTVAQRFAVMWLALLGCMFGSLLYFRMPVELLPKTSEKKLVFVAPSGGYAPAERSALLEAALSETFSRHGLSDRLVIEADARRILATVHSTGRSDLSVARIKHDLRTAFMQKNFTTPFDLFELEGASGPVMALVAEPTTRSRLTPKEQAELLEREVVGLLEKTQGVAHVALSGARPEEVQLTLNQDRLMETRTPATRALHDVRRALSSPAIIAHAKERDVVLAVPAPDAGVFQKEDLDPLAQNIALRDGKGVVFIAVLKSPEGNEVSISKEIRSKIAALNARIADLRLEVVHDASDYVDAAEDNVVSNLRDGIILTCVCILFFIRRWHSTVAVSLSIPISLLLTLPILHFAGISRNVMSLAGIALGVGVVVDATISVVNGIEELMSEGRGVRDAAVASAHANLAPISIAVLTTFAVFMPILLLDGTVGELFFDLAFTVIASQAVAFVCAILVTPSLTSLFYEWLGITKADFRNLVNTNAALERKSRFVTFLDRILRRRIAYWSIALGSMLGVVWGFTLVPPSEFLPHAGDGRYRATIHTGHDVAHATLATLAREIEKGLAGDGRAKRVVVVQNGRLRADFEARGAPDEVIRATGALLGRIAQPFSVNVSEFNPLDESASNGQHLEFFIPWDHAKRLELRVVLDSWPGLAHARWSMDHRVSTLHAARSDPIAPSSLLSAAVFPEVWQYQFGTVPLGLDLSKATQGRDIAPLVTLNNARLPWRLHPTLGSPLPTGLNDYVSRTSRVTDAWFLIDGNPFEKIELSLLGQTTGEVTRKITRLAQTTGIPLLWGDAAEDTLRSLTQLALCIAIATLLIACLLFAQTRSAITTGIILFTFVWGAIGSFPGLIVHDETLNASALVGFILLAGTIVNNGILLMEIVEKTRKEQYTPLECCLIAARQRTVPVLVTALTTALGMIPMVFETGAGGQMYRALSIVVVYGTLVSTPVSLVAIPALVMISGDLREAAEKLSLRSSIRRRLKAHSRTGEVAHV